MEVVCELVDPEILLSFLSSCYSLRDSKILFFDFVLILFQISLRIAGYLFEKWCPLMPLLLVAWTIVVRVSTVIKMLVKHELSHVKPVFQLVVQFFAVINS